MTSRYLQGSFLFFISFLGYWTFSTLYLNQEMDSKSTIHNEFAAAVEYEEKFIDVFNKKVFVTNLKERDSTRRTVVLLHGMKFTSQTWKTIDTYVELEKAGFKVYAIDLPGYGKSEPLGSSKKEDILKEVFKKLGIANAIVVSPSMSGMFSIPFVLNNPGLVSGFVPVAPVIEKNYSKNQFSACSVPSLIVYGENDKFALDKNKLLINIQPSEIKMIPNAGHPCYLDDPKLFHKFFIDFFEKH